MVDNIILVALVWLTKATKITLYTALLILMDLVWPDQMR